MSKFKIGDKVKIIRTVKEYQRNYIGVVDEITQIFTDYGYGLKNQPGGWIDSELKLVEKEQVKDNGINFLLKFETNEGGIVIRELQSLKEVRKEITNLTENGFDIKNFKLYQVQKERKISSNLQIKISK